MVSDEKLLLTSIEGPNQIGKGTLLERIHFIVSFMSKICQENGETPFKVASVIEPPDLPIVFPHRNGSYSERELNTPQMFSEIRKSLGPEYWKSLVEVTLNLDVEYPNWRRVLKEGINGDVLLNASRAGSENARFAEGFLTSRCILENFMNEAFSWTFTERLPPFIKMLPDIFGVNERNEFSRVLIKDRGTASTDVFQGDDTEVQEMVKALYRNKELLKEDVTFVVVPNNSERWLRSLSVRSNDEDIHDKLRITQLQNYLNLRNRLGFEFSKDIVYIENDTSGIDFHINHLPFVIALIICLRNHQGSLNWFDEGDGINSIKINLLDVLQRIGNLGLNPFVPASYVSETFSAFYERSEPRYFYNDIPLLYYTGDVGIIYKGMRFKRRTESLYESEVILAKDLREVVVKNPKFY